LLIASFSPIGVDVEDVRSSVRGERRWLSEGEEKLKLDNFDKLSIFSLKESLFKLLSSQGRDTPSYKDVMVKWKEECGVVEMWDGSGRWKGERRRVGDNHLITISFNSHTYDKMNE